MARTNKERAGAGRAALEAYMKANDEAEEEDAVSMIDLIADLLHYADKEGFDAQEIGQLGLVHYLEET